MSIRIGVSIVVNSCEWGPLSLCFQVCRPENEAESSRKNNEERNAERGKVRGRHKPENCKFSSLCALHHKPICSKLWAMMRGLWCWKRTELKLFNGQFHLNQVQSHLLMRSDPNTVLDYFWSRWLVEYTTFKFLHEICASLITTSPPWKWALIHQKEGWYVLTKSFKVLLLCSGERGYCRRKDKKHTQWIGSEKQVITQNTLIQTVQIWFFSCSVYLS